MGDKHENRDGERMETVATHSPYYTTSTVFVFMGGQVKELPIKMLLFLYLPLFTQKS